MGCNSDNSGKVEKEFTSRFRGKESFHYIGPFIKMLLRDKGGENKTKDIGSAFAVYTSSKFTFLHGTHFRF